MNVRVTHLLSLLQEGLPEELPGDVLHDAARLLQALVDRHRAHLQGSHVRYYKGLLSQCINPFTLPAGSLTSSGGPSEQSDAKLHLRHHLTGSSLELCPGTEQKGRGNCQGVSREAMAMRT